MCIAIIKPAGIDFPAEANLRQCFTRNRDGAGYCYAKDGKIHIYKGFMSFESFWESLRKTDKMFNLKKCTVFLHFRIATAGGISKGNCHPFPVVKDIPEMQKEYTVIRRGGFAAMHNGVLSIKSSETASDTMHYLKNLAGLDFWNDKRIQKLIQLSSSGSKLAFLHVNGTYQYYGDWILDGGVHYSNQSYIVYQHQMVFGRGFLDTKDDKSWGTQRGYWDSKPVERKLAMTCADCINAGLCYLDETAAAAVQAEPGCFEDKSMYLDCNE